MALCERDGSQLATVTDQQPVRTSGIGWLLPLVVLTVADYAWQVPYLVHQYGPDWPARLSLSVPLVVACGWFGYGIWLQLTGSRAATAVLAGFLLAEVSFYLLHNASGAMLAELLLSNPVLVIASILGYLNTIVAVCYLIALLHRGAASIDRPSVVPPDGRWR
ncbi:MAG: hypothetical protein ABI140_18810 [Jatrophihabitantaceae bacterium]